MKQETIQFIMQRMSGWLDNSQMVILQDTLNESLKMTEKVYRVMNHWDNPLNQGDCPQPYNGLDSLSLSLKI